MCFLTFLCVNCSSNKMVRIFRKCNKSLPPANKVWGKVIFSQVFVHRRRGSASSGGSASKGAVGSASKGGGVWGLHPGGWVDPQVCLRGADPPPPEIHGIQSTSGRYASYWNAFLFCLNFVQYATSIRM